MRITSFNVNGIRSFNRYVTTHSKMSFNNYIKDILFADILCLQETRGDMRALREFHTLKDYMTFTNTNKKNSGRCGVSTLVSKKLYCRGVIQSPYSEEGRSLLTDHGGFKVLNVYFPFFDEESKGDKSDVMEFYSCIGEFIERHDDLIVCGDFNAVYSIIDHYQFHNELMRIESRGEANREECKEAEEQLKSSVMLLTPQSNLNDSKGPVANPNEMAEGRQAKRYASRTELPYEFNSADSLESYLFDVFQRKWMKALIDSKNYIDTYRVFHKTPAAYTCWNTLLNLRPYNLGTRIDYVLIHSRFVHRLKKSGISPEVYGSDHCPVYAEIELEVPEDERNVLKKRKNNLLEFLKQ